MVSAIENCISPTLLKLLVELRDQWIKGNEKVYIHTLLLLNFKSLFLIKTPTERYQGTMATRGCKLKSLRQINAIGENGKKWAILSKGNGDCRGVRAGQP